MEAALARGGLVMASVELLATAYGLAAGAILATVVDTMIPEAFETTHEYAGLITAAGFILGCAITRAGG
jgi:ZIP family zinc transporter